MDLLTINETAEILKVSPLTVRRYIARNMLHASHVGRNVRIRRSEIERLIEPRKPEFETLGSSPLKGQPFTKDDPLWKLIGIGESSGPTDVSRRKHEYLAEAYEDLHE